MKAGAVTATAGTDTYADRIEYRDSLQHIALWKGGKFTGLGTMPGGAAGKRPVPLG